MNSNNSLDDLSLDSVLSFICESSHFGNLGLFAGAGFSMAVSNNRRDIAMSWGDLLKEASESFGIDYSEIKLKGTDYPTVASMICNYIADKKKISYTEAVTELKEDLARKTRLYPDASSREDYEKYISNLDPSWIITTNYDLVIESLLTGKCLTLTPEDSMVAPKNQIPIYHLHGVCYSPNTLVITKEDYVALFRPTEYRQIKLALMMRESTVLFLGYGLGDVNVLTALDWSRNVFNKQKDNYPNEVIQVIRKEQPKQDPYRDHNKVIIIETEDLCSFFKTLSEAMDKHQSKKLIEEQKHKEMMTILENPSEQLINEFITTQSERLKILVSLSELSSAIIASFMIFLQRCLDEAWLKTQENLAFGAYKDFLNILFDILVTIEFNKIPPALLENLAYNLDKVARYTGLSRGDSHSAYYLYQTRKSELTKQIVEELTLISDQHFYYSLTKLITEE